MFIMLGIISWMAFSIIKSVNTGDALFELLRIIVIYFIFLLATMILTDSTNSIKTISRAAAIATFILCVIATFQFAAALENYMNESNNLFTIDITSTLSNKNFFSEVLVLILPFQVYGLLTDIKKWKTVFILSIILNFCFLILLQTLAAWAGLVISLLFFLFINPGKINFNISNPANRKKIIVVIFVCVIGMLAYTRTNNYKLLLIKAHRTTEYITNPSLLASSRIENNNSVFERIIIWRNSLRMIAEFPLMGAGLNNWKLFYSKYGIGGTQYINTGLINYEHPHNDYLLVLAEQGPVGLILYLVLFIYILRTGIKKIRKAGDDEKLFYKLFLSGIVAFMIISLFAYPRSRFFSMILMMLMMALITTSDAKSGKRTLKIRPIAALLFIVAILSCIAGWFRVQGEIHTKYAMLAQINRNYSRMLRESEKAYSWFYPADLTSTPLFWYEGMALFYSNRIPEAIEKYEKALLIHPNHLRVLNDLATSYEQTGQREKAVSLYNRALEITPLFVEGNLNISAAYYNMNKIDSAFIYIDRIYSLPMSMGEENNYNIFLNAILSAKIIDSVSLSNDSVLIQKVISSTTEKGSLKSIYLKSKDDNMPFAKYFFENYSTSTKKN